MSQTEYGRIIDGKVVEYPVYELHIKNRAHPKEWYTEVIHLVVPEHDSRYEYIQQALEITGAHIVAKYNVVPMTVDGILNKVFYPNGMMDMSKPGEIVQPAEININDVDPALVSAVVARVSLEIGQKLDDFAKTRNYDDVKSAVTYLNSDVPQFKAEAERIAALRDQTYSLLYQYISDIKTGVKPIPKSFGEINAILPELTWE